MKFIGRLLGRGESLQAATARVERTAIERQAVQHDYPALFSELSAAFFEVDPVGINFDTNIDEYDPEVGTVLPRLAGAHSVDDVDMILREEFSRWFDGVSVSRQLLRVLADRVWEIWGRYAAASNMPDAT